MPVKHRLNQQAFPTNLAALSNSLALAQAAALHDWER
jgi:hypothetical protein